MLGDNAMPQDSRRDDDSRKKLWGVEAIGLAAGIVNDNGEVNISKTYRLLEAGLLPASKLGRLWVSTVGRIERIFEESA
jgi:hypothetical protein